MSLLLSPSSGLLTPAMPWETTEWFNGEPLNLAQLHGRVVVLEAFQMLCPSCVSHALPQAVRLSRTFGDELAVIGLHTVFEHHQAMTPASLEAFLHEYRIPFPVGVDAPRSAHPAPVTFSRYRMQGTPTTVLIDRDGMLRGQTLGPVDDMSLASAVTRLLDGAVPPAICAIDGTCT
ncbi:TlpA family protein disulfide reductase [Lentzea californiensis]|uniref:TlpA family protein disulfide reductase n=1 Tax=Lentzea californiensis TaxID=438851 RepID=UPI0021658ACD|nr:TlpA disulfide reductase family protein [Lentzea californiensis]MCR3751843.1 Peroxiredoxin [Lentzea californiensis]